MIYSYEDVDRAENARELCAAEWVMDSHPFTIRILARELQDVAAEIEAQRDPVAIEHMAKDALIKAQMMIEYASELVASFDFLGKSRNK